MPVHCLIFSRYNVVYDGEADSVTLPGINGQLTVLPKHIPMYAKLRAGIITVRLKSETNEFTVTGGFVQVLSGTIRILADSSESVQEIDLDRAEVARKRAEEAMKRAPSKESTEFLKAYLLWQKSTVRVKAAKKAKSRTNWIPKSK